MSDTAPKTLAELVDGLYKFCSNGEVDVDKAKKYMESYKSNRSDWEKYVFWDDKKYTRNLVDDGSKCGEPRCFNLIALCWNRGQGSTIHNHANADCLMKILDGNIREEVYKTPEGDGQHSMTPVRDNRYARDEVAHINDTMGLHRVSNPSTTEQTVTLHMYFPPFSECKCYQEDSGKVSVGQMTYYSKFGEKVNKDDKSANTCCGGKSCCN